MASDPDVAQRLHDALAGRYRIQAEIGRGGMAVVYLAEDVKHKRKVALKVLRPELAAALGAERFVREIEIAANLSHPLILPLHDSGEADGNLFYVMPYVDGESLRARMDREGKLPLADLVRITENVAAALTYAHQQGIVHRDVKPENILLTGGNAVVTDFGIARAVSVAGGTRLTDTGVAVGTPAYMSPEQAFGDASIDGRSDVYALGCVVYEMASGRAPFEAPTPQGLLAKHAVDTPRSLRTVDPQIPLFVDRAVARALAKAPAERFKTPNEMAEALRSRTVVAQVGRHRLAVLPPTDLTNDPGQEYFVQGMHNALISELQKAGIPVIARTSVLQYENTRKPIRDIAAELGVDALVEPSVFRSHDRVELEVRVVDGTTEEYLAAPIARAGELKNVLALTRELTAAIAEEIQLVLTPKAQARLATARTVHPEAFEAYLKGQFHWYKMTPTDLRTAMEYYRVALRHDPGYALAYAGISLAWAGLQQMGAVPPLEAGRHAGEAAARALEMDPTLVETQYASAIVKSSIDWDWPAAEVAFLRAIELNPNYPDVRGYYAHLLCWLKRPDEAMEQMERAAELDPFHPLIMALHGATLMWVGRLDEAIEKFRALLRTVPNHPVGHMGLLTVYRAQGRYEEAKAAAAQYYAAVEFPQAVDALESGYAEAGFREGMRRAADAYVAASEATWIPPIEAAMAYAFAGRNDEAVEWFERSREGRDPNMPYLNVWPLPSSLQSDARFQEVLRKVGLPL